jgi:hypothetical protein
MSRVLALLAPVRYTCTAVMDSLCSQMVLLQHVALVAYWTTRRCDSILLSTAMPA